MKHLWSDGKEGAATCMRPECKRQRTAENAEADDCGVRARVASFDADPDYIGKRMRELRAEDDKWMTRT